MTNTTPPAAPAPTDRPAVDTVFAKPSQPKRKPLPTWAKIAIGATAGLVVGATIAGAAGQPDDTSASPAPTVTVSADDSERVSALEADLAIAEAGLADCRQTVDTAVEAVGIVLGAFDRQIQSTMDAAMFGATEALVLEQEAINAEINRATSVIDGAPGC